VIAFYFDEHMGRAVAKGLTQRGYQAVMAVDVGMKQKDDDTEHLPYAAEQGWVMVTFDHPFGGRTMKHTDHKGLICLSKSIREDIGRCIEVLAEFAELYTPDEVAGQVFWLR
jgi:predicted nuclease of predicted toxin-antitoxin system